MARRKGEEVERCKSVSTLQRMIGGKWKIEILFYIALKDVRHFGQLRRCIGNISESTLSKQLKELVEQADISGRKLHPHPISHEAVGRRTAGIVAIRLYRNLVEKKEEQ